ncbi:probable RNA-dependent RNA polymerase 5 isoform X2 [Zingiber officinale]|uniref:probable RNA-dependent RNA polymerase 5 isoform X2 n=1 Tax=Zingiber officinale TaxID=94328 RepID=UPI001C4AB0FA|nr:probable RNA-dependent RNA polymerase 5 isoform X2 [Zingiber officinale]
MKPQPSPTIVGRSMAHDNALDNAVWLPRSVEELLHRICVEQSLLQPDPGARRALADLGEAAALDVLMQMSGRRIRNFSGFILYMANNFRPIPTQESFADTLPSGSSSPLRSCGVCSEESLQSDPRYVAPSSSGQSISPQLIALGQLEFRKAFLILSYLGRYKLEETISVEFIKQIQWLNMDQFESVVWEELRSKCIPLLDRRKSSDWDSSKAHIYHCHVDLEGHLIFKGPYLQLQRTHMQRVLGDDNVLLVKFAEEMNIGKGSHAFQGYESIYHKVAQEGILVGLRRYQFFVYKDGGKEKKKSSISSPVKCYFVRMESNWIADQEKPYILSDKFIHESRAVFMHVHTVSSLSKYMARFSLILSKTMKLDIDLASVHVEMIDDIVCVDDDGNISYDENGEPLIHTDGTGFISEDIALKCPHHIFKGKCLTPMSNQFLDGSEIAEEPLNITKSLTSEAFRLFNKGAAFKGTLLLNKLLPPRTIQVRPSMRKVKSDASFSYIQSCNSLEIVATSNRPKRTCLSRYLIALLHYGGVPNEYFLELLKNALDDAQNARYTKLAAIRVSLKYGDMDDFLVSRMILCGIPLEEPYMQFRLSVLMKEERKGLKAGKLPVTDCYYLMGTVDPTGLLKPNEVCVVLENGQISGDVLVYKHPGLHFGDIHVLSARYIKELELFVGDSKYAIFFPTKGSRSLADEMANSDFDGDMYWVSRNSQLLRYFRSSKPWVPMSSTAGVQQKGPLDLTDRELEKKLFDQFLANRFKPSYTISVAADCWLSYMDRLLTLSDDCAEEKECLKEKILKLVDIYYDAVDAPKSGLKVDVPPELKADKYPHYMEKLKSDSYTSTSILGLIFNKAGSVQTEDNQFNGISKLSCFSRYSESGLSLWKPRYTNYLSEMAQALEHEIEEFKEEMADDIIKKYKWMLYEAAEFEDSPRKRDDIFEEALAIYNLAYDYAQMGGVGRCSFAWNVAGRALCMLHASKQDDKSLIPCSRSVLTEILG